MRSESGRRYKNQRIAQTITERLIKNGNHASPGPNQRTWYTLSATGASGQYTATVTAPGATSYNNPGGYYNNITVEAVNSAGTTGTADASTLDGLQFYVRETVPPVVTILSPSDGAYVSNNRQPVVHGDGRNRRLGRRFVVCFCKIGRDGSRFEVPLHTRPITDGYSFYLHPAAALGDGAHTVSVEAVRQRRQHSGGEKARLHRRHRPAGAERHLARRGTDHRSACAHRPARPTTRPARSSPSRSRSTASIRAT